MNCFPAYSIVSFARLSRFLRLYPNTPSSRRSFSFASLWLIMSIVSSTIKDYSECFWVFSALRRLLSAEFTSRSVRISACSSVFSCANRSVPLAKTAIVSKIGVGELPRRQAIQLLTSVDCNSGSVGFCGVSETCNGVDV